MEKTTLPDFYQLIRPLEPHAMARFEYMLYLLEQRAPEATMYVYGSYEEAERRIKAMRPKGRES